MNTFEILILYIGAVIMALAIIALILFINIYRNKRHIARIIRERNTLDVKKQKDRLEYLNNKLDELYGIDNSTAD